MAWKSIEGKKPSLMKKVWIAYICNGISTNQEQTYAQLVGKDSDGDLLWHDFVTGGIMDNSKITVTHWMERPDNPILKYSSC